MRPGALQSQNLIHEISYSPRILKNLNDADTGLLDLLAGASIARNSRKRPAAAMDGEPDAQRGRAYVREELKSLLQQEVDEALRVVDSQKNSTFLSSVCPCCPWRRFDKRTHLRRHLISQHTETKGHCPSGTKQLRIAIALYDRDAIRGTAMSAGFLKRSAAVMRADVKPPVPTKMFTSTRLSGTS